MRRGVLSWGNWELKSYNYLCPKDQTVSQFPDASNISSVWKAVSEYLKQNVCTFKCNKSGIVDSLYLEEQIIIYCLLTKLQISYSKQHVCIQAQPHSWEIMKAWCQLHNKVWGVPSLGPCRFSQHCSTTVCYKAVEALFVCVLWEMSYGKLDETD